MNGDLGVPRKVGAGPFGEVAEKGDPARDTATGTGKDSGS